jgi:hypothetical protein
MAADEMGQQPGATARRPCPCRVRQIVTAPPMALAFSERTVVMSKGRIVYNGASAALRADPEKLAQLVGLAEAG